MIGFLMAAFTKKKQALHDVITGCLVIQKGKSVLGSTIAILGIGLILLIAGSIAGIRYWLIPTVMHGMQQQFRVTMQSVTAKGPLPEKIAKEESKAIPISITQYETYLATQPIPFNSFGTDNGSSTTSGPASFKRSNFWTSNNDPHVWVKVQLPLIPNLDLAVGSAQLIVDHVWDNNHNDIYNRTSPFETATFERISFSEQSGPPPYLSTIRDIHLSPTATLDTLSSLEGRLLLRLPVDCEEVTFNTTDAHQEKSIGAVTVSWVDLTGSDATINFKGPVENYMRMEAFNAQGQPLQRATYTIPSPNHPSAVTQLSSRFNGVPTKVVVIVAKSVLEHSYSFLLNK